MSIDSTFLNDCLEKYLRDKLDNYFQTLHQDKKDSEIKTTNRSSTGETKSVSKLYPAENNDETKKQAEKYQYRIWQLKDRLSYGFFGPDSESLADDFIDNFNILVEKGSNDYYQVLREVLNTEIQFYSFLLQQSGAKDDSISAYYQKLLNSSKDSD
ncbi:MAG TPA: hypothetical protein VKN82_09825 [Desulfohalobiaceae bacterium]|nr:hypothetical protein [Desulfohalobiaceae bacterium]